MKINALLFLSLYLTIQTHLSVRADVLLDDYNSSRSYPECCDEFGTYYSFASNAVQNGGGTLLISGTATNNGGLFRGRGSTPLLDLRWQTGLVLRARSLPTNLSTNVHVWLHDWNFADVLYSFSFSALNTNTFTSLTNSLLAPLFGNATNFDFAHVVSWDLLGEFSDDEQPFALEVDSLSTLGPPIVYGPALRYVAFSNHVDFFWPTGSGSRFALQSAPTILGAWTNEAGETVSGTNYVLSKTSCFLSLAAGPSGRLARTAAGGPLNFRAFVFQAVALAFRLRSLAAK